MHMISVLYLLVTNNGTVKNRELCLQMLPREMSYHKVAKRDKKDMQRRQKMRVRQTQHKTARDTYRKALSDKFDCDVGKVDKRK